MGRHGLESISGRARGLARSLGEGFLELAWPTRCVACDMPGELLCADCAAQLSYIDGSTACRRCGAPYGSVICTECWKPDGRVAHRFTRAMCALEFEGVAARMVVAFKDGGELRLASMLAGMIAHAVDASGRCGLDALVPIPASPRARLRRGYDHVELIARPLAEHLRVPLLDVLELGDIADQRGLDRDRRYENMGEAFSLRRQEMVSRLSRVLLVDDVLTTGATLDAAADVLLSGGVDDVVAATACRVW